MRRDFGCTLSKEYGDKIKNNKVKFETKINIFPRSAFKIFIFVAALTK